MKWFKHFSDSHRGQSIQDLLDQLGHTGLCYYVLVEMCAEKLEKEDNGLTEVDCSFSFHTRIVRQNLRISATNLRRLLDVCATNGLLSFEFSGNTLEIKMPILLNLLERNTKKARTTRISSAQKVHLDKDKDKDKDKEKNISTEPNKSVAVVTENSKKEIIIFKVSSNLEVPISQDLVSSWMDTYPKEFVSEEMKKARSWILSNPQKAPKSAWGKFFNGWLVRGWERYRTTLKSNPTKLTETDMNEILGGIE